jgi:hypothetical protein
MIMLVGQGRMLAGPEQTTSRFRCSAGLLVLIVATGGHARLAAAATRAPTSSVSAEQQRRAAADSKREQADELEKIHSEEGEAVLALADAAMAGRPVPSDFAVEWQNDFVKAQRGTFVPFTLSIDASRLRNPSALVYVRARRRESAPESASPPKRQERERNAVVNEATYSVDAIFPVELAGGGQRSRISRGFSVLPGEYDVFVVVRERVEPGAGRSQPKAVAIRQPIQVPEFWSGELTTSTVMLADRLTTLDESLPPDQLAERPYVIGRNEITPAVDRRFRRDEELIVVLLVYNPMVTSERQFDVKVEYHFFRKLGTGVEVEPGSEPPAHLRARAGEQYFNHTDPQSFTPALTGAGFNPGSGEPVMAGQVVPLAGFAEGEYRLEVQVRDLLSGKSISRDVFFTVEF